MKKVLIQMAAIFAVLAPASIVVSLLFALFEALMGKYAIIPLFGFAVFLLYFAARQDVENGKELVTLWKKKEEEEA